MKLHKALKLRKRIVGEISRLKDQINTKNSYIAGSVNPEKYSVNELYIELQKKIDELVALKFVINEANREIQSKIYILSETKALIAFWNEVSVVEGTQTFGYADVATREYNVQIDEEKRNQIVREFQIKVDALQEELDTFNYTTEIPWGKQDEGDLPR